MAKKSVRRASKKTVSRSRPAKKKPARKSMQRKSAGVKSRKLRIASRNLVMFVILFVLSLILYYASGQEFYVNLFFMLSILFGFLAMAFLIAYLVLFFMKVMRK